LPSDIRDEIRTAKSGNAYFYLIRELSLSWLQLCCMGAKRALFHWRDTKNCKYFKTRCWGWSEWAVWDVTKQDGRDKSCVQNFGRETCSEMTSCKTEEEFVG